MSLGLSLLMAGVAGPAIAADAGQETYVVLASAVPIGALDVRLAGHEAWIEYKVVNNGRGPSQQEHVVLDPAGIPEKWDIDGKTLAGGTFHEGLTIANGRATWDSQADGGNAELGARRLYIGNDASPWALGIYARYLLRQPGHEADVLPAGHLAIVKVRDVPIAGQAKALALYRLQGLDLEPRFLVLDHEARLVSVLQANLLIRKDYEPQAGLFSKLFIDVTSETLTGFQQRLAHRFDRPVRITNVRIFDARTGVTPDRRVSVVVSGDSIATVDDRPASASESDEEIVIDGEGGTIVPGLTDMHTHSSFWSGLYFLAAGVTSTRDMGNDNDFLTALKDRIDRGEIPGPRIVRSGFLEGKSALSAHHGFIVDTLDDGLAKVRWYADHGYWQIKTYNSIHTDWLKPLAAEAHRLGMPIVGHTPAFTTPDQLIEAGYDELTHINQLALGWLYEPGEDNRTTIRISGLYRIASLDLGSAPVRRTLAMMKAHGTGLDTTMVIQERLAISRARQVSPGDAAYLDHMPIAYQRYRKRAFVPLPDAARDKAYFAARDRLVDLMALLNREGIRMWPGTDDGTGVSLHRELELYTMAGMTAGQVLRRATLEAAEHLGVDQRLGSIERGKLADFSLYASDPAKDINAIRAARMVVKNGAIYFPSEIYAAVGVKPFATAPKVIE